MPTVDVSINSWINSKVDIMPYGPMETGVVILTSLSKEKMVNFRVADSGDHIYDTAIVGRSRDLVWRRQRHESGHHAAVRRRQARSG